MDCETSRAKPVAVSAPKAFSEEGYPQIIVKAGVHFAILTTTAACPANPDEKIKGLYAPRVWQSGEVWVMLSTNFVVTERK